MLEYLKKENNNLDLLRFILASLVILSHADYLNGSYHPWTDPIYKLTGFSSSGDFAVKVFFFISGLLITNSMYRNSSTFYFLVSRVFRLFPTLIFVVALTAFVIGPLVSNLTLGEYFTKSETYLYFLKNSALQITYDLPGVFKSNPGLSVNGSLWTLIIEFRFYLLLLAVHLIIGIKQYKIISLLVFILFLDTILFDSSIIKFYGEDTKLSLLPFAFSLGVFVRVNAAKIKLHWGFVGALFYTFYFFRGAHFEQIFYIMFICFFCLYLSVQPFFLKLKIKRDLSYGVYLWGYVCQQLVYEFWGSLPVILHVLISLVMATCLAYISNVIIEQPGINLGRRIYTRYKSAS